MCVCALYNTNTSASKLRLTYYCFLFLPSSLLLSSPLLSSPCCGGFVCKELHRVRLSCNINGLLMDYGMVSAGLRERGGPPDAPPLLTAWPTQLNYSSNPPSWMLPVLSVSTTRELCAVSTLFAVRLSERVSVRKCECAHRGSYNPAVEGKERLSKCFQLTCP